MALDATIGGTSADTYATLAEYAARASAMGWTLAGTSAQQEVHLRRAAAAIDATYSFVGIKQYQRQARAWPRYVATPVDDWPVEADSIPGDIKAAQMELAYLIQGGADPLATQTGIVARTRAKAGPVETETEYQGGQGLPRYTAVERLLRPYLRAGSGQVALVRA